MVPFPPLALLVVLLLLASSLILLLKRRTRPSPQSRPVQKSNLERLGEDQGLLQEPVVAAELPPPPPPPPEEEPTAGGEKRRKKKGKKKRSEVEVPAAPGGCPCPEREFAAAAAGGAGGEVGKAGAMFPFSSFASATQRRIKAHYDELVKSNQTRKLTMAQVGQFVNCLVEARNELQHKSEILQRSFKIKKALLVKADRSSFDRLCQQIGKLEAEHKRLEEDAAVYNLLQEQLKLSPAYKTMLEVGARMETEGNQDQDQDQDQPVDFCDISFEELLAQEKKDSFWQRNGKLRSFPS